MSLYCVVRWLNGHVYDQYMHASSVRRWLYNIVYMRPCPHIQYNTGWHRADCHHTTIKWTNKFYPLNVSTFARCRSIIGFLIQPSRIHCDSLGLLADRPVDRLLEPPGIYTYIYYMHAPYTYRIPAMNKKKWSNRNRNEGKRAQKEAPTTKKREQKQHHRRRNEIMKRKWIIGSSNFSIGSEYEIKRTGNHQIKYVI